MACDGTCMSECKLNAMILCGDTSSDWKNPGNTTCGFGCYWVGRTDGGNSCEQCCNGLCVGECATGNKSRCIENACQWHCYASCKDLCIVPVSVDPKDNKVSGIDCIGVEGCNVQCSGKSGFDGNDGLYGTGSGYCNGGCASWCQSFPSGIAPNNPYGNPNGCMMFCIGSAGGLTCGTSGDRMICVNTCNTTCWASCEGTTCTHDCSTSDCRVLCTDVEENNSGGSGAPCDECDGKCEGEENDEEEVTCSICNEECTDECSENANCSHQCMESCKVVCDQGCDGVCIEACEDHCYQTCSQACSGCDDKCTACDQSCQNVCIVTCTGQCAACRTNCTGQATSETDCQKLCRACTNMCINTCVNSCITWNSGGTDDGGYRSNSTNNNWIGFSSNNAPKDNSQWYGPTTNGYSATNKAWTIGIVNLYPNKPQDHLPEGYGVMYSGSITPPAGVGSSDGARGDFDYTRPGEQEWYRTNNTDSKHGHIDWTEDFDYDKKRGL